MGKRCTRDEDTQNLEFNFHVAPGAWRDGQMAVTILCDIRRELKRLNGLLHCGNFTAIPTILREICRNTTKKRRKKVRVAQTRPK